MLDVVIAGMSAEEKIVTDLLLLLIIIMVWLRWRREHD